MRFEIEPDQGAGPVRFGMTRDAVRSVLAAPYEPFRKRREDEELSDAFHSLGVVVFYQPPGVCTAIEFDNSQPTYDGRVLLGEPAAEIIAWIKSLDHGAWTDVGSTISSRLGIGIYAPADAVETVIAFARGYFDDRVNAPR
jgi:hypothetical protein